jgi:Acyl-CoA carboxylase epsilon subunit
MNDLDLSMIGAAGEVGRLAEPDRPLLRVIRGDASPVELAALLAVVAAYATPAGKAQPDQVVSAWNDPASTLRGPIRSGRGAWVTSGWQPGVRTRPAW